MDVVLLTAACVVGLVVAGAAVAAWGGTRTTPAPIVTGEKTAAESARRMLRAGSMAIVGGSTAGILVGGLGGRLMMRILAATSGDDAQGRLTEAEEVVGQITLGGTLGFIAFVGIFGGVVGGAVYLAVRRWLPGPSWLAGLVLGLLLLFFARLDPLDPDNVDFAILEPTWLAVLLVAILFPIFGMVTGSVIERMDRSWPLLESRPRPILAHVPLLLLVPGVPLLIVFVVAILAVLTTQRIELLVRALRSPITDRIGRVVLAVGGMAVAVWVGAGIADILRS